MQLLLISRNSPRNLNNMIICNHKLNQSKTNLAYAQLLASISWDYSYYFH